MWNKKFSREYGLSLLQKDFYYGIKSFPLRMMMMRRLWRIQPLGRHAILLVLVSVHYLVGLDSNENGSFRRRFRFINPDHF